MGGPGRGRGLGFCSSPKEVELLTPRFPCSWTFAPLPGAVEWPGISQPWEPRVRPVSTASPCRDGSDPGLWEQQKSLSLNRVRTAPPSLLRPAFSHNCSLPENRSLPPANSVEAAYFWPPPLGFAGR